MAGKDHRGYEGEEQLRQQNEWKKYFIGFRILQLPQDTCTAWKEQQRYNEQLHRHNEELHRYNEELHRYNEGLHQRDEDLRRRDEALRLREEELRRQKRKKWIRYIIAFLIFQTAVIVVFYLTVIKFRTPNFRLRSAGFDRFEINTSNSSFNFRLNARVGVKNANFGTYKFDTSTIVFCYRGVQVGIAVVPSSKANFRSTKNFNVVVDLILPANVGNKEILATDLSFGILHLTSVAEMEGQVTILFFKKKISAKMDCNIEINTRAGKLQNINC